MIDRKTTRSESSSELSGLSRIYGNGWAGLTPGMPLSHSRHQISTTHLSSQNIAIDMPETQEIHWQFSSDYIIMRFARDSLWKCSTEWGRVFGSSGTVPSILALRLLLRLLENAQNMMYLTNSYLFNVVRVPCHVLFQGSEPNRAQFWALKAVPAGLRRLLARLRRWSAGFWVLLQGSKDDLLGRWILLQDSWNSLQGSSLLFGAR